MDEEAGEQSSQAGDHGCEKEKHMFQVVTVSSLRVCSECPEATMLEWVMIEPRELCADGLDMVLRITSTLNAVPLQMSAASYGSIITGLASEAPSLPSLLSLQCRV